ncbi:MAG: ATP-binding protein [Clostridiales Family XIII bacterium]|jgi:hypothetical protein|nr:ATP-binding protein [Clostridiales Family XIII bacterium]
MYQNPFTPVFGNEPPILAGRDKLISDVLTGLDNPPGDPNRITIFTGPRGSGKTVLLAKIVSEAGGRGFIGVLSAAYPGMLDELREQVAEKAAEFLPKKSGVKLKGAQAAGFGVTIEQAAEAQVGWRTQMSRYLDILAKHDIGLLFAIDEVTANVPEMVQLVSTFQFFIMEKRNVALMMAGLPNNVLQMFRHESISFLRRAFRRKLDPLRIPEVRAVMKKTIELSGRTIEDAALKKAAENTSGMPFLIQLIGYHAFNQSDRKKIISADVDAGIESAREDMESMILDATLFDLSETDIRFLIAMTKDEGESRISDIAARMDADAAYVGIYRRRLIEQGVISPVGRGRIAFNMPMLKFLLKERFEEEL